MTTLLRKIRNSATPGPVPGMSPTLHTIALRAVFGQDEANHGTTCYPVGNDGLVHVPLEAVPFLTATGGFAMAQTAEAPTSAGIVKLHHANAAGCSYGGRQYCCDRKGDALVPAEAATELAAHGFVAVPCVAEPMPKQPKPRPGARPRKG